jgi:hypothetical protein
VGRCRIDHPRGKDQYLFTFFIPTAIKLQNAETLTPARIHGMVSRWVKLNSIRCTLNLLGWILAIEALALYF